jgi:hypothetical protein
MHPDYQMMIPDSFHELMELILKQKDGIPKIRIIDLLNRAYQWYLLMLDEEQPFPGDFKLSDAISEEWKKRELEIEKITHSVD